MPCLISWITSWNPFSTFQEPRRLAGSGTLPLRLWGLGHTKVPKKKSAMKISRISGGCFLISIKWIKYPRSSTFKPWIPWANGCHQNGRKGIGHDLNQGEPCLVKSLKSQVVVAFLNKSLISLNLKAGQKKTFHTLLRSTNLQKVNF